MMYELLKNVKSGKIHSLNTFHDPHDPDSIWTCSICGSAVAGNKNNLLYPFEFCGSGSIESINCKSCLKLLRKYM